MPMLPVDILAKVVFYIADAAAVLALLDAIRPGQSLGAPLESLYLLMQACDPSVVWPVLGLMEGLGEERMLHYEAVAPYYSHVQVHGSFDIAWLRQYMSPAAFIHWNGVPPPDFMDSFSTWVEQWATLRIQRVSGLSGHVIDQPFLDRLSTIPHLKSIDFTDAMVPSVDLVLSFAATSDNIIDLVLENKNEDDEEHAVTATTVGLVRRWFRTHNVRRFWFGHWAWDDIDDMTPLFASIFNCPTLEDLSITSCDLEALTPDYAYPMRRLALVHCTMSPQWLEGFAKKVATTAIEDLVLNHAGCVNDAAIVELVQALPKSRITSLDLSGARLIDATWPLIVRPLQATKLRQLQLTDCSISDVGAAHVAQVLEHEHCVMEWIKLRENGFRQEGIDRILRAATEPLKRIDVGFLEIPREVVPHLKALADSRGIDLFCGSYH